MREFNNAMNLPIKVTFDKNVYEFVVHPSKEARITQQERVAFEMIHQMIRNKRILPFLSESTLTYEAVAKEQRLKVLAHSKPLIFSHEGTVTTISPNPEIHPGNHFEDDIYLTGAIEMGFRILPGRRLGKLVNPAVKKDWYHLSEDRFEAISERFSEVVREIELLGGGYRRYHALITTEENKHLNIFERVKMFNGSLKQFAKAISEWSDGDSVALHIAYDHDFFCTNDNARNAGGDSVFNHRICSLIDQKFGFKKISPLELAKMK